MTELVLTAYDVTAYLREALPALKAAVYRGNLAPAKEVLLPYDEMIYEEYDLSMLLVESDFSGLFTEAAAHPETLDPDGALIGLTYPLILAYHRPEVFRIVIGGSEFRNALPFLDDLSGGLPGLPATAGLILPGYREGLRAMWEIIGYVTPDGTVALRDYCLLTLSDTTTRHNLSRLFQRLAQGLQVVTERGFGLVVERD